MFRIEEKIEFLELPNCIRLTNGDVEIIVTTDVGPRILKYSFVGGENILGLHPEAKVETPLGDFKPYGGHRLWIAPEKMPESYAPDNSPVEYFSDEKKNSIRLIQPVENTTETRKELEVTLDKKGSGVSIKHKIANSGAETIEAAAWAITITRGGGEALIPNEPFAPHGDGNLLPVRNLALWSYTDLTDSRFAFDNDFIRLRTDEKKTQAQKIGVLNKREFVVYRRENLELIKRFKFHKNAEYPDMNSNTEVYTAGSYIEVETLSPLEKIAPGNSIEYAERWELFSI